MNQLLIQHCKATTLQDFFKIIFKKKKKKNPTQAKQSLLGWDTFGNLLQRAAGGSPALPFPKVSNL